jgi:hypothetical protein
LEAGVSILQELALVIEEMEKDQITVINVQLLDNASAVVQSGQVVTMPEPILINASPPAPGQPYPYP